MKTFFRFSLAIAAVRAFAPNTDFSWVTQGGVVPPAWIDLSEDIMATTTTKGGLHKEEAEGMKSSLEVVGAEVELKSAGFDWLETGGTVPQEWIAVAEELIGNVVRKSGLSKEEAEAMKSSLEAVGAEVELKRRVF